MQQNDTLKGRMDALEEALKRGKAKKVEWPTVSFPRTNFKRLPKDDQ